MKLKITGPDIPVIIDSVGKMKGLMNTYVNIAFEVHGKVVTANQKAMTPVDTWDLRDNNEYEVYSRSEVNQLAFFNDTLYGRFQEFGTGLRGATASPSFRPDGLVWNYDPMHPGNKPQPFFYPPILASRDDLTEQLKRAMEEVSEDTVGKSQG